MRSYPGHAVSDTIVQPFAGSVLLQDPHRIVVGAIDANDSAPSLAIASTRAGRRRAPCRHARHTGRPRRTRHGAAVIAFARADDVAPGRIGPPRARLDREARAQQLERVEAEANGSSFAESERGQGAGWAGQGGEPAWRQPGRPTKNARICA